MAKWADYLISGVYFSDNSKSKYITHVQIHNDNDSSMSFGEKKSETVVINRIKNGYTVKTIVWDYTNAKFIKGAEVDIEKINGVEYLRTHRNKIKIDNLENLPDMEWLGFK